MAISPYLTTTDAQNRLSTRFDIGSPALTSGDVDSASDDLDLMGPFVGVKDGPGTQNRQFPRSVTLAGDTAGVVPDRILDWVALRAYQLATEDRPAIVSEGVLADRVKYARPKKGRVERLMASLLKPYKRGGVRIV